MEGQDPRVVTKNVEDPLQKKKTKIQNKKNINSFKIIVHLKKFKKWKSNSQQKIKWGYAGTARVNYIFCLRGEEKA